MQLLRLVVYLAAVLMPKPHVVAAGVAVADVAAPDVLHLVTSLSQQNQRLLSTARKLREDFDHLARDHEALITIEEGAVGGFGSHVAQLLAEEGVFDAGLKFRSMVLPDIFIDQSSPADMYAVAGMNAEQIEAKVLAVLGVAQIAGKRA